MGAGDAQADGAVGDALVGARQPVGLRLDLLSDALVIKEALAGAVQELCILGRRCTARPR